MTVRLRVAALVGAVVLAASCFNDVCGCLRAPVNAIIYGIVRDTTGATIRGATISLYGVPGTACSYRGSPLGIYVSHFRGSYRAPITWLSSTDSIGCVLIRAGLGAGRGMPRGDSAIAVLTFRQVPPIDSVRVDLTLH